ncbi:EamA family transporter [Yersinia ruckeri]|uniref:EamA family transporter n=1 Tax=Yersinia ruckeri TaxID=29486 RepID=UPI000536B3C8|nr:EamA family transporter [Yersinia ruckeri]AUQ40626.1 4-amino-4-deoxy-L-arabinose-phospho-UDP flippase [Yersinia ruckeri]OJB97252.1 4-amino-4-deoxy-L-arabinose-phospho-UDP flippase [Yersinia ruckeri]OJC00499.1 4-amino-4-deoxy-L-arabinose-phospho-UDP flippase [Yersinia ruckeri]OJC03367.1 4-amino-4-deoxy-L-arabinose-phospho-UDP flippase [Yersinia ruckeri]UIM98396.1 EamA family transporter [Yersinia ruckeri]
MFYLVALLCVIGIAAGQILFKISASELHKTGRIFASSTLWVLFPAFFLYGVTTLAWVWVLQHIELNKAYPLMAFAFVIVPIGGYFILGERFNSQYIAGVAFIIVGVVLAVRS